MCRVDYISIDLNQVRSSEHLHQMLMEQLDFPSWYGRNWDAFWDAITGLVDMPETLEFVGWSNFQVRFPRDAHLLKTCFDRMAQQYKTLAPDVKYR